MELQAPRFRTSLNLTSQLQLLPGVVDLDESDGIAFGELTAARSPRQMQFAPRLYY
jgi:hypothetical protein